VGLIEVDNYFMIRTLLDQTRQDATYAFRALRREPGLTAGIVLTFALAIGANAAMFGLVGRLLLGARAPRARPG